MTKIYYLFYHLFSPMSCDKQNKLAVPELDLRLFLSFVLVIISTEITKNNQVYEFWAREREKHTIHECWQTFFLDIIRLNEEVEDKTKDKRIGEGR